MVAERAAQAGDYSFNNIGISGYFMLLSTMPDDLREEKGYYAVGGCGGNIAWHTENDQLDVADKEILERDIKIYLLAVLRNANAEILPFDWRLATREFGATLERYASAAGERFDLAPARTAVDDLHRALETFYRAVEAGGLTASAANAVIAGLARELIPVNFTRDGAFRHDPALVIPQLPDLALALELTDLSEERLGFAQMELMRGRNRVVASLRRATRQVLAATA